MRRENTALEFISTTEKDAHGYTVYSYLIHSLPGGEVVGDCCLRVGCGLEELGNIGYALDEKYRNRGHATAACQMLIETAEKLGLCELYICCEEKNAASRRVCEKLGMLFDADFVAFGEKRTVRYKLFCKNKPFDK